MSKPRHRVQLASSEFGIHSQHTCSELWHYAVIYSRIHWDVKPDWGVAMGKGGHHKPHGFPRPRSAEQSEVRIGLGGGHGVQPRPGGPHSQWPGICARQLVLGFGN